jgi:Tfp pilus assembly protein PilV
MVQGPPQLRARFARLSRSEGYSLIELLVAMMLTLVVMVAIFGIWFGLQRTYSFTDEDLSAQEQGRAALNEIVEFVRTAREPDWAVAENLDVAIVRAEPNLLICWADVDRDATHDLELVRFRVDTTQRTLYRDESQTGDVTFATGSSTRLVGNWVSNDATAGNWLFTYTGLNGAALDMSSGFVTDPTQIREVNIVLKVDVVIGKSPEYHELRSTVQPRNLRLY